ncbi:MAG: HAMP domain-containing sensor histidine kinase [Bdellovibrionota bacterium]
MLETNNLKSLVDEFLDFAKKPAIQSEASDLHEFMEDIQFHWQQKLQELQADLSISITGPTTIFWDIEKMKRVFHNLIENALHAMTLSTKEIRIDVETKKNHTLIHIHDTGTGIQKQHHEKLFKPFLPPRPLATDWGLPWFKKLCKPMVVTLRYNPRKIKGQPLQ